MRDEFPNHKYYELDGLPIRHRKPHAIPDPWTGGMAPVNIHLSPSVRGNADRQGEV
jgi:hypothetical protein